MGYFPLFFPRCNLLCKPNNPITASLLAFYSLFSVLPVCCLCVISKYVYRHSNPILSATARGVGYPAPVPGAGYFILVPIVCLVASPSTSNQALFCSRRADRSRLDNVHLVCRTG